MSHVAVQQKLTEYCKSTVIGKKNKNNKTVDSLQIKKKRTPLLGKRKRGDMEKINPGKNPYVHLQEDGVS